MFITSARLLAKLVLPAAGVVVDGLGGLASSGQKSGGGIDPEVWMQAYTLGGEAERRAHAAYAVGRKDGLSEAAGLNVAGIEAISDVFADEVSASGSVSSVPMAAVARGLFDLLTLSMSAPWAVANSIVAPTPPKPVA